MSDFYQAITYDGYENESGAVLWDVTRNRRPFIIGVDYMMFNAMILSIIQDYDQYQEFHGGKPQSPIILGHEIKRIHRERPMPYRPI